MIKTRPYDPTRYFHDDEDIAVYLQVALQESIADNDYSLLAHAIETSAKARGMTALANATGIPRNELYDLLEADAPMPFATLHKLLAALGVQVSLTPAAPGKSEAATEATTNGAAAEAVHEPAEPVAPAKKTGKKSLPKTARDKKTPARAEA